MTYAQVALFEDLETIEDPDDYFRELEAIERMEWELQEEQSQDPTL